MNSGKLILLVEDDALISLSETAALKEEGYEVVQAFSGEKAVELFSAQRDRIDLILMDIDLGKGMDGTETARAILMLKNVPILFISSHNEKEIIQKTEQITSYGYVSKSSGESVMLASIKMAFRLYEANHNLSKASALLQVALDQSPAGIMIADAPLIQLKFVNRVAEDIFSEPAEKQLQISAENPGLMSWKTYRPDGTLYSNEELPLAQTITEQKTFSDVEMRIVRKDGSERWIMVNGAPIIGENGELLGGIIVFGDVTEKKKSDRILVESEEKYRLLFENMTSGFALHELIYDADGKAVNYRYLEANPAFGKLTGLKSEDIIGKNVLDVIPNLESYWIENYARVVETGEPEVFENYAAELGKYYEVLAYSPSKGRFAVLFSDITQRKKIEMELKSKSDELEKFFNNALDLLCIADTKGYFRRVNSEWEKVLGYTREELIGSRFLDFVHPDDKNKTLDAITDLTSQNEVLNFINRYRTKDGSYRWIEWKSFPAGELIYAAARDISVRLEFEETLRKNIGEKEMLMKELQHRVKNNMMTIISLLNLESIRLKDKEALGIFREAQDRIRAMMLIYDKLYQSADFSRINLGEYLKDLVSMVYRNYKTHGYVRLNTRFAEVILDMKRCVSIGLITNEVITNSLKYAFPGNASGEISVKVEFENGLVKLDYSDDGSGVQPGFDIEKSERFGLKLVKLQANELNGTFSLGPNPAGKGTRIEIVFPFH